MAVTCTELPGRTTGWSIDDKGVWSFNGTRQYQILSDSRLTGFESVSGLPAPGDSWAGVPRLRVASASASEVEEIRSGSNRYRWTVTINYTSRPFNFSDGNNKNEVTTSPIDWSPVWSGWRAEQIQITPMKDLDNKKWLNSANDMFSSVPTITLVGASVTVTKNYTSFSGSYALSLIGKCNADTFSGATQGQLMISDIVPTEKNNGEMTYYEVAITIKYSPIRWDEVEILNIGSHVLDDENKKKLPVDSEGNVHTSPVLLTSAGKQIEYGDDSALSQISYKKFRVCDSISFNALGLI